MTDLLSLSAQIIDEGAAIFPVRINQELSEIADGVAVVESFSNVIAVKTEEGLLLSDTSAEKTGAAVVESLRAWTEAPFHTVLYTHGHVDHVGGVDALVARALVLAEESEFRLACHLIEMAVQAAPDGKAAHAARSNIYAARRDRETSLMAKGIYGAAVRDSDTRR